MSSITTAPDESGFNSFVEFCKGKSDLKVEILTNREIGFTIVAVSFKESGTPRLMNLAEFIYWEQFKLLDEINAESFANRLKTALGVEIVRSKTTNEML